MPRDLMLHGRLDEATSVLTTIRDELRRHRALVITPQLAVDVRDWCGKAIDVYGTYLRLEKEARDPKSRRSVDAAALEAAKRNKETLWVESAKVHNVVQKVSADYMAGEVTYLIALCKQEQAERAQSKLDRARRLKKSPSAAEIASTKNAWRAAAGWWNTCREEFGATRRVPAARLLNARALQALGDPDGARSLLQDLPGTMSSFDRMARLYLSKQLESH
jgi:hypothetical protein